MSVNSSGRSLPHSLEAEECLLSCCLIDAAETLGRCLEAGLTAPAFYHFANQIIFSRLADLRRRDLPVALETLIEELRTAGQLEAVGGMPYLMQVSARIPTTAQAGYFIDQVRGLYLRRRIIAESAGIAERCFADDASPASLLDGLDALKTDAAFASVIMRARLDSARLRPDVEPPELREVFTLNRVSIATPGNLVAITAQAKAGKTAFLGAMLAASMAEAGGHDFLGLAGFNAAGHGVVHIDSEQSPRDHWQVIQTALRRAGLNSAPPWLHSYGTAGWPIGERRAALEPMLKLAKSSHGGIHAVLLDGVADFVLDPNAGEECFPFVDSLQTLGVQFDCPIIGVLHLNPGTEKSRGHLGSQLERRAETNLILEKDGETGRTVVYSTRQRRAPIIKADGPCFRWDDAEQMHVGVETVRAERDAKTADAARELAFEVFAGRGGLTYSAVISGIKAACGCCDRTADKRFKELHTHKAISRCPPNLWALTA